MDSKLKAFLESQLETKGQTLDTMRAMPESDKWSIDHWKEGEAQGAISLIEFILKHYDNDAKREGSRGTV